MRWPARGKWVLYLSHTRWLLWICLLLVWRLLTLTVSKASLEVRVRPLTPLLKHTHPKIPPGAKDRKTDALSKPTKTPWTTGSINVTICGWVSGKYKQLEKFQLKTLQKTTWCCCPTCLPVCVQFYLHSKHNRYIVESVKPGRKTQLHGHRFNSVTDSRNKIIF